MNPSRRIRRSTALVLVLTAIIGLSGCGWRGLNSLPLPGTVGDGPGSFVVQAQLPDIGTLQQNSRVRVGDVTVGNVTDITRQDWHALVTMRLDGGVELPANVTAKLGQTSLLGSQHLELAAPQGVAPTGALTQGSVIPLSAGSSFPTTEQTLATVSMLLNGGGIPQLHEVTEALNAAVRGRENDLRSLINQLDTFIGHLNRQTDDIIRATDGLNNLAGQLADRQPVIDEALRTLPDALGVLNDQRDNLANALVGLGQLSALTASTVEASKEDLVKNIQNIWPVLESAADAGPAMTRSLSLLTTFPWPKETITNWMRGDYANFTQVIDLTLSRLDASFFTGTRFAGNLTELEMQWGRTIGQVPSPYTATNPLIAPYHLDQGP